MFGCAGCQIIDAVGLCRGVANVGSILVVVIVDVCLGWIGTVIGCLWIRLSF
jgi:hypothetical protein